MTASTETRALLVLEDGEVFEGVAFGAAADAFGEVVFNTGMTGYQEVLTDPSYQGQIVTMTYPHIGNYGVNDSDLESAHPRVAGFVVRDVPEGHLCCGSAGTYNLLQPEIAGRLRDRKLANIATVAPDLVAAGNIGCITQLAAGTSLPILHTVELLDWATGGPVPAALRDARCSG